MPSSVYLQAMNLRVDPRLGKEGAAHDTNQEAKPPSFVPSLPYQLPGRTLATA